jgi:hypothetical protein
VKQDAPVKRKIEKAIEEKREVSNIAVAELVGIVRSIHRLLRFHP